MSTLLYALGRWSYRHPWRVLVAWLLLLGIAGGGAAVFMTGHRQLLLDPGHRVAGRHRAAEPLVPAGERHERADRSSSPPTAIRSTTSRTPSEIDDTIADARRPRRRPRRDRPVQRDGERAWSPTTATRRSSACSSTARRPTCRPRRRPRCKDVGAELERRRCPPDRRSSSAATCSRSPSRRSRSSRRVGVLIALLVLIVTFRSFAVAGLPLLTRDHRRRPRRSR